MPSPRPPSEYRLWIQRVIWGFTWFLVHFLRTDVCGTVPDAPCIIVSNHFHNIDAPLAGRFAIRFGERVHWLAKVELFHIPVLGAVLRAMQTVPVDRDNPDRQSLQHIISYARLDKVWIFPEGHRSGDGHLQPAKEGVALIARHARVPLVPIGIVGTQDGPLPLFLHRKTLRIRIGEPFTISATLRRAEVLELIEAKIEELLPAEHRRVHP
ncbi:MAG: 1-acyl-sn-glycerol-3-phosphate acyltransferase [Chloroflexi bacterium]|nr:1-acyl-sn-glycerol-3-phosphate acyltransferase [Chloroflexota bacterium]